MLRISVLFLQSPNVSEGQTRPNRKERLKDDVQTKQNLSWQFVDAGKKFLKNRSKSKTDHSDVSAPTSLELFILGVTVSQMFWYYSKVF